MGSASVVRRALSVCAILMLMFSLRGWCADLRPAEFQAAFLAKSLPYVTWPEERLPKGSEPIVIGLLDRDPFDGLLHKLLENQKINDRAVVVKVIAADASVEGCHVLFVPEERMAAWAAANTTAPPRGLLTVGADDSGQFLKAGGVFNLLVAERRLEISLKNARKSGLEINSKLIQISKPVR
jgi:hypothetical protein